MSAIDTASAFAGATNDRSPSAKFGDIGTKYSGTVTRVGEYTGINAFNGSEETSVTVDLDIGAETVTLWARTHINGDVAPNGITRAVADAIREATGRSGLPAEGARLAIEYYADGQSSKVGMSPPKLYRAKYQPATDTPTTQVGGPFDSGARDELANAQAAQADHPVPAPGGQPSSLDF